jgi:methionyl-tRNA formyltransferase
MRILLVAEDAPGIQILKALHERGSEVVGVVAKERRSSDRGATIWATADRLGARRWPAERVRDPSFSEEILDAGVDLLLNAYSLFIIDERVVEAPRIGSFNLHPGPLPAYAGLNSPSWAILRGEIEHGVTVHRMEQIVDTGPIAYRSTFPIDPGETGLGLSIRCIRVGVDLVMRLVDTAARDLSEIPAIPQDLSKRSYFGGEIPYRGRISWSLRAKQVCDFVRACDFHPLASPWGTPVAVIAGREFGVAEAIPSGLPRLDAAPGRAQPSENGSLLVACADEWIEIPILIDHGTRRRGYEALGSAEAPDPAG